MILKSGRERSVYNRHPWIFSGAVKTLPEAENGAIVEVTDNHNQLLGYGFFDPKSQIVCRMFEFSTTPVNVLQAEYWYHKVQSAYLLRKSTVISPDTTAYRLLHAEGDFLPGVICDVYDDIAVLQLLVKGVEQIHTYLIDALQSIGIQYLYLKNKQSPNRLEEVSLPNGFLTDKKFEGRKNVLENGLRFEIDFEHGQKTGFFLDQRENRNLLKKYCHQKKVLNAFCYTGGFSVYALAGGATEVHSVDISKEAVIACDENVVLNFGEDINHTAVAEDCFDYLKTTEEKYDVIVLDPPAFAKNAKAVPNASRGYKELNLKAIQKINPKGIVFTFSCSQNIDRDLFRKIVFGAAADARREVRILHQLTQPSDHPISIFHPEGEYLKGLVLQVE